MILIPNATQSYNIGTTTTWAVCSCKWQRECIKPFVCTTITEDSEAFFASRDAGVMTGVSTCRTLREFTHFFYYYAIIMALQSDRPFI